jgi:hypothetical protein
VVWERNFKNPDAESFAHVAAIVQKDSSYIEPIWRLSRSQSSALSWMMHAESIHRYLKPRILVVVIASCIVKGRSVMIILRSKAGKDAFVKIAFEPFPQQ